MQLKFSFGKWGPFCLGVNTIRGLWYHSVKFWLCQDWDQIQVCRQIFLTFHFGDFKKFGMPGFTRVQDRASHRPWRFKIWVSFKWRPDFSRNILYHDVNKVHSLILTMGLCSALRVFITTRFPFHSVIKWFFFISLVNKIHGDVLRGLYTVKWFSLGVFTIFSHKLSCTAQNIPSWHSRPLQIDQQLLLIIDPDHSLKHEDSPFRNCCFFAQNTFTAPKIDHDFSPPK